MAAPGLTAPFLRLPRFKAAVAPVALAVLMATGAAIAVLGSSAHSPLVQGGQRGLPDWMGGPFTDAVTAHLTLGGFYLLIGAMCAAYVVVLAAGAKLRARWVVAAVLALHVAFLLAPPMASTDVFNYIDYARLGALHGLDPYIHGPIAARHDPAFAYTAWRHIGSAYGPLFTIASYPLAHMSVAAALWSLKAVTALASLACVGLVWPIARRRGSSPAVATAAFGLNPVLLIWAVAGAHNDVLMLALTLAAVWLVLCGRHAAGGAALVAAVAIKATAGVVLPFALLATRHRVRLLAGVAAAAAVVYALSALVFTGHALGFVSVLRQQHLLIGYDSVPEQVALLFGFSGVTPGIRAAATLVLVASLIVIAVRVWRGSDWIAGCGWAMVAVIVTSTWFLGWYAVWPLPFAALSRDRRLLVATLGLQAFFVVNHVPGLTH